MTVGGWLAERTANVPRALIDRVTSALGESLELDVAGAPECCIAAAESMLAAMLARSETGRDVALELLAVDALATYAFESAAEEPSSLARRAEGAMTRFSRLGIS